MRLVVMLALVNLASACATLLVTGGLEPERSPQAVAEAALEDRVSRALRDQDAAQGARIDVDATGSDVTLSGSVSSYDVRQRAVAAASRVDGVDRVIDQLTVESGT
jgi:osmotically-inducible protein OsmY